MKITDESKIIKLIVWGPIFLVATIIFATVLKVILTLLIVSSTFSTIVFVLLMAVFAIPSVSDEISAWRFRRDLEKNIESVS